MISRLIAFGVFALCLVGGVAAASADQAEAKLYKGTTGQGYRIKVMVKDQRFKVQVFDADVSCQDERVLKLTKRGFPWAKAGKRGTFRETWSRGGDTVIFRGRLTERGINGAMHVSERRGDGVRCSSWTFTFGATPR